MSHMSMSHTSFDGPTPEQMPENTAGRPEPKADSKHTEPLLELEPTELNESKKDTAHSPCLVRVHSGHIVLTSPHPVVSRISAQARMVTHSPPTPSSARAELYGPLKAPDERASSEPSTPKPDPPFNSTGGTPLSAPTTPKVSCGHMSEDSFCSSTKDAIDNTLPEPANPSCKKSPATEPSQMPTSSIPIIRVQQPTRDPSQMMFEEGAPEHPSELEIFVKAQLQHAHASPDGTTAAPNIPVTSTERLGRAARSLQAPVASPLPASVNKPHKSRLLLRRCRNRLVAEPLLNFALGRSVAKVAKPALRLAAHPTEAVLALEQAVSIPHSELPVRGAWGG
jgi:hypothetical protein